MPGAAAPFQPLKRPESMARMAWLKLQQWTKGSPRQGMVSTRQETTDNLLPLLPHTPLLSPLCTNGTDIARQTGTLSCRVQGGHPSGSSRT